ncbi:MAG TPA: galactokinase [Anaerolineales bacterium]|nr:galactokinase [Anaerolineales bacterium]HNB34576.1 galactokinase [Anaerolineales bacterium]
MDTNSLFQSFKDYFNSKPQFIVRAPGRVNLIGEHTDYNDGFVLPMAIDRAVWLAIHPRSDGQVRIHSLDLKTEATFQLDSLTPGTGWIEYPKGVASELMKAGYKLHGFDAVMTGDVPRGAGLSSSAAVELAVARAFATVSNFDWDPPTMASISQKAENHWVGVNCGIMDQMASAACKAGHALFLDCRSLEIQQAPLPHGVSVVILDTSTRRGLVDSAYNERRSQCEEAARWFRVKALRDVGVEELSKWNVESELSEVAFRRARHIVTENARVLEAIEMMRNGDVKRLGELFNASHASLRDDFEVTNEALNMMVECANEQKGCHGARMTGAGFGGCAVALVEEKEAETFTQSISSAYRQRSGLEANIYVCKASEGANLIEF